MFTAGILSGIGISAIITGLFFTLAWQDEYAGYY